MRTLPAACRLRSAVFLLLLSFAIQLAVSASAVMPPSTSLETSDAQKTDAPVYSTADADLGLQILAEVRQNQVLLQKIEQEENIIAARLQNDFTRTTLQVTRS